jgi:4-diphosphocytidyl-2-C-methyl-D-erythritol kinase
MQAVGLEDELVIRLNESRAAITLECDVASLRTDQTNLVYRAAVDVLSRCGRKTGLDIFLAKRIPTGAGLGGGSSDAAATIIGLNRLLNLGWSVADMAQMGQTLGSDVPFFFFAPSAAVAGRGEAVTPVRITGTRWVVLVNPGFPVETKWAYHELASTRSGARPLSDAHVALGRARELSWEEILGAVENDFELPVFRAHPDLQEIKRQLLDHGAQAALLSGSGATVFGIFPSEAEAHHALAHFRPQTGLKVFAVATGAVPRVLPSREV